MSPTRPIRPVWLGWLALVGLLLAGCTSPTDQVDGGEVGDGSGTTVEAADPLPLEDLATFSGVASLNAGSNCSGTVIDTGVSSGPAYVLTNGHCVGDIGRPAQLTTLGLEWFGTAEFFRAEGNLDSTLTVDVLSIEYSTMRLTDTAVIRLDATLGELEDLGVASVPIAAEEPSAGEAVVNVGVPVQDLDYEEWVLRRGECTLGQQHTLIEGAWLWQGVWANDCPGIIQGSSGSPLFTLDGEGAPAQIVAMINTTTTNASPTEGSDCTLNHPCAADAAWTMAPDTSYAQSVAEIGNCFDAVSGVFGLTEGCPLPTSSVWSLQGGGAFRGGDLPNAFGAQPTTRLSASTAGPGRTVLAELMTGAECTTPETYEGTVEVSLEVAEDYVSLDGTEVPVALPEQEGRYVLCAVSGEDYQGAASVLFEVDRTPPTVPAAAEVDDAGGGAVIVRPHLVPPQIQTVRFTWGPAGEVECSDTTAFQDFFIVPLTLESADLPATYCLYGLDVAGNAGEVTQIDIPGP